MDNKLGTAILKWLNDYQKMLVKAATFDRLLVSHSMLSRYPIAEIDICELTTQDVQDYLGTLVDDGYALTTIKKQKALVSSYLRFAFSQGLIFRPIYEVVRLPSKSLVKKPAREIEVYEIEEQQRLLDIFQSSSDPAYGAAILMLEAGLRVGEALALTWDDIDWRRKAVSIAKTLVRIPSTNQMIVQKGAKSHTSNRIVPLNDIAIDALRRVDKQSSSHGYIFCDDRRPEFPLTFDQLRWRLKIACRDAEVDYRGNHVFRHTFATNCYNRGCDVKILSKLLGHADTSITYNIYIHLFGDALEEMRNVVG